MARRTETVRLMLWAGGVWAALRVYCDSVLGMGMVFYITGSNYKRCTFCFSQTFGVFSTFIHLYLSLAVI